MLQVAGRLTTERTKRRKHGSTFFCQPSACSITALKLPLTETVILTVRLQKTFFYFILTGFEAKLLHTSAQEFTYRQIENNPN